VKTPSPAIEPQHPCGSRGAYPDLKPRRNGSWVPPPDRGGVCPGSGKTTEGRKAENPGWAKPTREPPVSASPGVVPRGPNGFSQTKNRVTLASVSNPGKVGPPPAASRERMGGEAGHPQPGGNRAHTPPQAKSAQRPAACVLLGCQPPTIVEGPKDGPRARGRQARGSALRFT